MTPARIEPAPGPVLVFGGPYSNFTATTAMRDVAMASNIPVSNCICNGDIVAYCGRPGETVELIRDWGIAVVMGNCEESLASNAADCGCGFETGSSCDLLANDWYSFARQHMNEDMRSWMRQLPRAIEFTIGRHRIRIVHGSVKAINQFIFPSTEKNEISSQFEDLDIDIIIGGHCGIPFGRQIDAHYWLNCGAIGMPANDGTRDGWYLLLDPRDNDLHASWHRLEYNAADEKRDMQQQGMDSGYADSLLSGLWPSMDILPEAERLQRGNPLSPEDMILR